MILLLENDELTATSIRGVLPDQLETIATPLEVRRRLETPGVHTVVLGPSMPESAALDLASAVRISNPDVGVIAIRPRLDTATLTKVMRAGARDALSGHDIDKLAERVAASAATTRAIWGEEAVAAGGAKTARIITVYSPKGGTGKTTLSTNLACALASQRHSVALLDYDVAFGDVALAMDLRPENTLADAVAMENKLDEAAVTGMLTPHGSGVHVLAAPVTPAEAEAVTPAVMQRVLEVAARHFDFVVVDTAPTLDERTLTLLERSDRVLFVATPDAAALRGANVALSTLRLLDFPMDVIRVVLNRGDAEAGISADEVPDLIRTEVVAVVPSSRDVPASTNHGLVLTDNKPKHPVSKAVHLLAEAEAGGTAALTAEAPQAVAVKGARRAPNWLRRTS